MYFSCVKVELYNNIVKVGYKIVKIKKYFEILLSVQDIDFFILVHNNILL